MKDWMIIVIIILFSLIVLTLLTTYICYRMAFYSKNKPHKKDEINLPDNEIFKHFKPLILSDIFAARAMEYQEFYVKSFDGLTLYGKYYESFKDAPIELMFHGYRGDGERDLSTGIRRAKECGRNVLIVDQRGHGKSEGHTISFGINERLDCLVWINKVIEVFGQDIKIILTGISMGAATVLMASNLDLPSNAIGILADCGYDSPKNIIIKYINDLHLPAKIFYPFVKLGALIFGHFNIEKASPIESVKEAKVPIIFIHGEKDTFVPCSMSEKLYKECISRKQLTIIKNAEHGISYLFEPETYVSALKEFFKNEK
ncbi:MAG: alpha/beta hydrolase [Bacilli bacterium]|nr:alpha/beta hydrolase [Bacilli bacterium]